MKSTVKKAEWNSSAKAKSILTFVWNFILLSALILLVFYLENSKDFVSKFESYSTNFIYTIFCYLLLTLLTYLYFVFEDKETLMDVKRLIILFIIIDVSLLTYYFVGKYVSIYARPVVFGALMFVTFFGRKNSIYLQSILALFMFILDNFTTEGDTSKTAYSAFILAFIAGMVTVFCRSRMTSRIRILTIGFIVFLPVAFITVLLEFTMLPSFREILSSEQWIEVGKKLAYGFGGCIGAVGLFWIILPIIEIVFNQLTPFRIRELTDSHAKLLKRLNDEAPGTYNHCTTVAFLAESCARALGESVDWARAAAFYHDVGKLHEPGYFTENQSGVNPHMEIPPELSADLIRSHTQDGYDLIKEYKLPDFLADVAIQHHGTLPIRYFYAKALSLNGGNVNIEDFSYAGPKPQSVIAAIIMIVDACEAACRALKDRSPDSVEKVVRGIIEERMNLDQFSDCDITMKNLTTIQKTLVTALSGVHHHRVEYPPIKYHVINGETRGENEE